MGCDAIRYVFWVSLDFWVSVLVFQVQSLTKFRNNMAFITQPITYQPEKRTQKPKIVGKPEKRIEVRRSPIHDFQVEKGDEYAYIWPLKVQISGLFCRHPFAPLFLYCSLYM